MPRARKKDQPPARTPLLNTRLNAGDYLKLEQVCRQEGLTKTELLRKAMLQYLDRCDQGVEAAAKDRLADILEAMEAQRRKDVERLARMLAGTRMDIGIVNQVLYARASEEDRAQVWGLARKNAAERLRYKRKHGDADVEAIVEDALSR